MQEDAFNLVFFALITAHRKGKIDAKAMLCITRGVDPLYTMGSRQDETRRDQRPCAKTLALALCLPQQRANRKDRKVVFSRDDGLFALVERGFMGRSKQGRAGGISFVGMR
jgi:hypothetical protein